MMLFLIDKQNSFTGEFWLLISGDVSVLSDVFTLCFVVAKSCTCGHDTCFSASVQ
jgi:hypothetical protein